jgi:hypothetical protein
VFLFLLLESTAFALYLLRFIPAVPLVAATLKGWPKSQPPA